MKTATTALVAIVALATSSIACSSPAEKEEVDTGSALSALRSPTGSFSEQTAGKAFGGYRSGRANSSKVSTPGAASFGGGGTTTQSIRLLDRASSSGACSQGESCACPNGGSLSYTGESSADGQLVKVTFDSCGFEDGWGFDGKAILLASKKSLLGISAAAEPAPPAKAPSSSSSDLGGSDGLQEAQGADSSASASANGVVSILLAAKGTATDGQRKLPLEFALVTEQHYAFLAVAVPDGKIVIGVSDDGRAIVKSKEGTWTCRTASKGWSCTSDKGKSMDVAEEEASDSVASADDTSASAPSAPATPPPSSGSDSAGL